MRWMSGARLQVDFLLYIHLLAFLVFFPPPKQTEDILPSPNCCASSDSAKGRTTEIMTFTLKDINATQVQNRGSDRAWASIFSRDMTASSTAIPRTLFPWVLIKYGHVRIESSSFIQNRITNVLPCSRLPRVSSGRTGRKSHRGPTEI